MKFNTILYEFEDGELCVIEEAIKFALEGQQKGSVIMNALEIADCKSTLTKVQERLYGNHKAASS